MKTIVKWTLCLAAIFAVTGAGFGQSSTQGAVGGTVLDGTGAVIAKATVTIRNNGTNAVFEQTTDDSGNYKAPLLEPGTYTVEVKAPGFGGFKAESVVVQVGQFTELTAHLGSASSSEVVNVTSDVPALNFDSPDFTSVLNQNALENVPVNNRRWSALALLTPGVTVDSSGYGLISVRGISTILNNVEIDGADDNQAYFSEERGRTREAYSTSGSAVREFAVNTGVYAAEYGRAAGGVVNSVTKSGTNSIHGEAYFWDRESKWNAYQDQTTLPVVSSTGAVSTVPFKPKDIRKIYGFTAGGALIKDKLFWIYTYDQHSRIFPFAGVPGNPAGGLATTSSPGFNQLPNAPVNGQSPLGTCLTNGFVAPAAALTNILDAEACTLAARLGSPGNYTAGYNAYVSGIALLNTDIGLIPRTGYQEINTPKLDWQVNPKEHVSFLYHRLRWDSPGGVQTSASGGYAPDSAGNDFVKLDYGVAKLTSLIGNSISNEVLYQYGRELNDETLQKSTPYSLNQLQTPDGNIPYVSLDTSTGFFLGAPYYSFRPKYPDERKWQIGDTLYFGKGNNSFKFGVDILHNYDLSIQSQYYEGEFIYTTNIANYLADLGNKGKSTGSCDVNNSSYATSATAVTTGIYPCYNSYQQGVGLTSFDFSTLDYGFFGQDNWKILPRLTLELGLRYDYESLPGPVPSLTQASGTFVPYNGLLNHPSDKNNFGPRIGFSYDAFGTGKTVVRGGYGIYYGRITNGNVGTALSTTAAPIAQSTPLVNSKTGAAAEPVFPYRFSAAQLTSGAKAGFFLAQNLQNPQVQEMDLQVQQQLGHGTAFQIAYLGGMGRNLPNFLNVNLDPTTEVNVNISVVDSTGKGPLPAGSVYTVPTFTKYGNVGLLGPSATSFQAITEYLSNINSSYNALSAEIVNRSLRSIQFDVNYTWAHALDYYQNASTAGSTNNWYDPYGNQRTNYGNSSFDIPNRFVAYAIYNFPNIKTHSALQYATNDWSIDTSFQMQNGLPYSAGVSGSNSSSALLADWNGNGSVSYVPQLGHNNLFYPRDIVDDLRVEKQFAFTERYHLQVFLQAFNVANHQNVTSVNTPAYKLAGVTGNALAGTATYQSNFGTVSKTNNTNFSYTPRQLELAVRLAF